MKLGKCELGLEPNRTPKMSETEKLVGMVEVVQVTQGYNPEGHGKK